MPNLTPNYSFQLPLVNDPTDQDLWGGELNTNWSSIDTILNTRTQDYAFAGYNITSPTIKSYAETIGAVSSSAGVLTLNFSNGPHFTTTLSENITSIVITNAPASGKRVGITLAIKQAHSASYTVAQPSLAKWVGVTAPTMSSTNDAVDLYTYITDDGFTTALGLTTAQGVIGWVI